MGGQPGSAVWEPQAVAQGIKRSMKRGRGGVRWKKVGTGKPEHQKKKNRSFVENRKGGKAEVKSE